MSLSQTLSDIVPMAKADSETVMAVRSNHNVVNIPESTGNSLPVDDAENQNIPASAASGFAHTQSDLPTDQTSLAHPAYDIATAHVGVQASQPAADPSAGEAVRDSAGASTVTAQLDTQEVDNSVSATANAVHDAAQLSDGQVLDANTLEGSVDASLTSDTEGSRGDASEVKSEGNHHARTNSVKKPTTFSRVSVAKNFLAKSSTASAQSSKPGEKVNAAQATLQSGVAKPRLVAKSGPTITQKARTGSENVNGPDASKVWNKNRPVPLPPPKQFTDEELKQQYGIHLATRIQTEENGKDSKWADIDDDEDDWVPASVVWMDGTKSALTPSEVVPIQKEQAQAPPQPRKSTEGAKPTLIVKKVGDSGPPKVILKPGASALATQAKQSGTGGGSATDTAPALAKSSATPSKSPWAALPPIDKVPPVNPPVQQQQPFRPAPFASQDARAYEAAPQVQAREIAADTFDRSWRESEGAVRELYNSANGRYEPVQEGRRGSVKPDSTHRKPSVLQRPSQNSIHQTESSSNQMDGSYARRRGSSVNQGTLPPGRPSPVAVGTTMSPSAERQTSVNLASQPRASHASNRDESSQPVFSHQTAWNSQMPAQPEAVPEAEDPVKVQERVMREKREVAKKRRQEEEQRLEVEKQERLKARLAALEGAGKSRREREAEAAATVTKSPADKASIRDGLTPSSSTDHAKPAEMTAAVAAASSSELEAQTRPLGLNIEQIEPLATIQPRTVEEKPASPIPLKVEEVTLPARPLSTEQQPRQQPRTSLSPRSNVLSPFQQSSQQQMSYSQPPSSYASPGDRKQQPFARSPLQSNDAHSLWLTSAPNGNVWGTSGIGNGTFQSANGFAPMPMSQQGSALPPPPGMSRPPTSTRISPQSLVSGSRSPNLQHQSLSDTARNFPPPGLESNADPFTNRINGALPAMSMGRQTQYPAPIGPPSRSSMQQSASRPESLSAWNSAARRLPYQYQSDASAVEKRQIDLPQATPPQDTIKETFKQTTRTQGKFGEPRRFDKTEYTVHNAEGSRSADALSPAPPNTQTQPPGPFTTTLPAQGPWKVPVERTVRIPDPSLNPAHGGSPAQVSPTVPPSTMQHMGVLSSNNIPNFPARPLEPSFLPDDQPQPPPETASHPAHDGNASHPLVRLPLKPTVKLPPALLPGTTQTSPQTSAAMPHRPISGLGGMGIQPIAQRADWQARFNGLFGRASIAAETPPSPPKTPPKAQGPLLAVTPSSRTLMDELPAAAVATVSLPSSPPQHNLFRSSDGFAIDQSSDATSKSMIEQMFNEELGHGSRPRVAVPRKMLYNKKSTLPRERVSLLNELYAGNNLNKVDVQSQHILNIFDIHPMPRQGLYVKLPLTSGAKGRLVWFKKKSDFKGKKTAKATDKSNGKGKETPPKTPITDGVDNGSVKAGSVAKIESKGVISPALTGTPATTDGGKKKQARAKAPRGAKSRDRPAPAVVSA